jgi:hypothetical protein
MQTDRPGSGGFVGVSMEEVGIHAMSEGRRKWYLRCGIVLVVHLVMLLLGKPWIGAPHTYAHVVERAEHNG